MLRVEQEKNHRRVSVNTNIPLEKFFKQTLAEEAKETGQNEEQLLISHGLSLDECKTLFSTHFSIVQENEDLIRQMKKICELSLKKKKRSERYLLLQETALFINFDHANIVKFYGYTVGTTVPHVIMKFYSQGDLDSLIQLTRPNPITEEKRLSFSCQMLQGLAYLHDNNIVHGDLKPANMLLDEHDTLVLADFGLSTFKQTGVARGTLPYMAPELLEREACNTLASDIFAVGVVFWELLSLERPWKDRADEKIKELLRGGTTLHTQDSWPKDYVSLLTNMWLSFAERPQAKDILRSLETVVKESRHASNSQLLSEVSVFNTGGGGASASESWSVNASSADTSGGARSTEIGGGGSANASSNLDLPFSLPHSSSI